MRLDCAICSSVSEITLTGVDAAASTTLGAGKEPAVTNPSICPFLSAATALLSSASAISTLSDSPNISRYFAPSVAPKDPLPRRMLLPSRSAIEVLPSNIALPSWASPTSDGGVVKT